MSTLRWQILDLSGESAHAKLGEEWNELWERSAVSYATARWEQVLNWRRLFAPDSRLLAVTVHEGDHLRAALPLVQSRVQKIIPVWRSLWSHWAWAGDLLVDSLSSHPDAVFDHLVNGIRSLCRPWLWFDAVDLGQNRWQGLLAALARRKMAHVARDRFAVGKVVIHDPNAPRDWAAYQASWSGNFRRQMRKMLRRAEELGGVELEILRPKTKTEIAELLQRGFAVEDRSWKGAEGSSVLRMPLAMQFYQEQAESIARADQLELAFLRHKDVDIAFEYAWFSKGVYCTPKIGYDEQYSHLSPGQLIRYLTLERFFADPERKEFDFIGPLSDAIAKWTTETYNVSSLVVSTGRLGSNASLRLAERFGPKLSKLARHCRSWFKPATETSPAKIANEDQGNVSAAKSGTRQQEPPPSQPSLANSTLQVELV